MNVMSQYSHSSGSRCVAHVSLLLVIVMAGSLNAAEVPAMIRGTGDAAIRCAAGEPLVVTVSKIDLNIYEGEDAVTVQLSNPWHEVVQQAELPDDGNAGKGRRAETPQSVELRVPSARQGTYRLRVRGGGDLMWGVSTTADKLVIEAPMHLNNADCGGRIYFKAPDEAFVARAQAFHDPGIQRVPLLNGRGEQVHLFDLEEPARDVEVEVGSGRRRGLWCFEVERMDVKLGVDGVSTWALSPEAWFETAGESASLLPKAVSRYVQPGQTAESRFRCYADDDTGPLTFAVRRGAGAPPVADASVFAVDHAPVPGTAADYVVKVRVRAAPTAPAGQSTWFVVTALDEDEPVAGARLECRIGESPVSRALSLPIVNRPHKHESYRFGYAPDYITNEVYFGLRNRPFIRTRWSDLHWTSAITFVQEGEWVKRSFLDALAAAYPEGTRIDRGAGFVNCKIAFDGRGGLYTMLCLRVPERGRTCALLYTPDEGKTWQVTDVGGSSYDLEVFSGHNTLDRPPPVLIYDRRAKHPTARWGAYHSLKLYLPRLRHGQVVMGEPVTLSEDCIGACQHSGGPPSLVTREGRTHVIWGDATEKEVPGVPTFAATVDHQTRTVLDKTFVGFAPPPNDVHNVPAVCLDSKGFIHMITGAHGDNFTYRQSRAPNTLAEGLTDAVNTLEAGYVDSADDKDGRGRQTYCSLVCDDRDTLHIAYRQWRRGVDDYHLGSTYAALTLQSKQPGQPWSPATVMVVPPMSGYSIYYHKLTLDRIGGLWLSYSYYSGDKTYQADFPERYNNAAILVSKDRGETWKLAETSDFVERVTTTRSD